MALTLVGLNHRTAPVDVRERLSVSETQCRDFVQALQGIEGVRGASYLSTCNRAEALFSSHKEDVTEAVVDALAERSQLTRAQLEEHVYILKHRDVISHMFRVASGLDSLVLGEPQIAGQVKSSFQIAQGAGTLDSTLISLFEQTMRVAKKVRTDTGIGEHAVSIPFAAVELARKIFGELAGLQVLLVGAGKIGELTAQNLNGYGLKKVFVANRAYDRALQLAERFSGEAIQFDSFEEKLSGCDIVLVSTGAPHYVITRQQVEAALATRRRRNLFLIDLSVPRNIDPAISELPGAFLYNVDDLKDVADTNREKRLKKAEQAEEIVDAEVEQFLRKMATHEVVPTILELQQRLDEIRRGELEKCLKKMGPITTEQRAAVEMLSSSIINKVAHYPILRIKESAADQNEKAESIRDTIRKIFGLR
jgi:glutamyl-tRNA reductase